MSQLLLQPNPRAGVRRRALLIGLLLLPLGLALASSFPLCPMASLLGTPCPGCGLSRATLAALRGDFGEAYRLHPLVFMLVPVYALAIGSILTSYLLGARTPTGGPPDRAMTLDDRSQAPSESRLDRAVTWVAFISLVALLVVWIARFMGYFGGPVPVTSVFDWARSMGR